MEWNQQIKTHLKAIKNDVVKTKKIIRRVRKKGKRNWFIRRRIRQIACWIRISLAFHRLRVNEVKIFRGQFERTRIISNRSWTQEP